MNSNKKMIKQLCETFKDKYVGNNDDCKSIKFMLY